MPYYILKDDTTQITRIKIDSKSKKEAKLQLKMLKKIYPDDFTLKLKITKK